MNRYGAAGSPDPATLASTTKTEPITMYVASAFEALSQCHAILHDINRRTLGNQPPPGGEVEKLPQEKGLLQWAIDVKGSAQELKVRLEEVLERL